MKHTLIALTAVVLLAGDARPQDKKNPVVVMETSMGKVEIELYPDKAPITVKNFLSYVDKKFYDGTIFHRVISSFMIQCGGFDKDMKKKETDKPIKNEAENGLKNLRGTLAMARTNEVDSATSQFFINTKDNKFLDNGERDFGYCVFAKVTAGMDVVDKIKDVKTTVKEGMKDVPEETVEIKSIRVKEEKK